MKFRQAGQGLDVCQCSLSCSVSGSLPSSGRGEGNQSSFSKSWSFTYSRVGLCLASIPVISKLLYQLEQEEVKKSFVVAVPDFVEVILDGLRGRLVIRDRLKESDFPLKASQSIRRGVKTVAGRNDCCLFLFWLAILT